MGTPGIVSVLLKDAQILPVAIQHKKVSIGISLPSPSKDNFVYLSNIENFYLFMLTHKILIDIFYLFLFIYIYIYIYIYVFNQDITVKICVQGIFTPLKMIPFEHTSHKVIAVEPASCKL